MLIDNKGIYLPELHIKILYPFSNFIQMKKIIFNFLFIVSGITSFAQVPSYVPTNGLVGWWPFNGNANDESGNTNHCTTVNGPVLSPDRNGVANKSYLLDGIDDWIQTNSSFFQTSNPHTISMWWKTTDSTKVAQTLFNTNPHTLENCSFHYSSTSPTPPYDLSFGLGNGLVGTGSWNVMDPDLGQINTTPPTMNLWHHLVWVKDATLTWKFYFDGVLIHTFGPAGNTGTQNANLRFGAENNGFPTGGANFKGNLDDIGLWDRALTQQEITNLYTSSIATSPCLPSNIPTAGLVGFWPFCGNANDESGNGNHCTIVNGPVLSSDRNGNANNSYLLDGIDDWIQTNSSLFQTSNPHTISMWWKTTDSTKVAQTLFNTNPHTLENCSFHYSSTSPTPPYDLSFGLGNGLVGTGSWNVMDPDLGQINTTPPTMGLWHHLVWVKDVTLTWKFYFDGALIHTFGPAGNTGTQNANLRFGAENNGFPTGGANFKGNLDDIGLWNRALTQQEITSLYQGCSNTITYQSGNQSVNVNATAQFVVTTSSSTATYQWQQNSGTGYANLSNFGQYLGVTNDTLTISNVTLLQNNYGYRCLINDNGCLDTTTTAILTVINNTGIANLNTENSIVIYPNPAKEMITIETSIPYVVVSISNVLGQEVINKQKTKIINIETLKNGIYFIQLFDESGKVLKKEKFVKG